jgi:hypothetical protein
MGKWFVHPGFLWLAPLVALPILIHLLNRIRYRRVRWAAIDFLLTIERRAVRRARLRQILLMVLRMLLLAAALGALAQPKFRGGLAALLGGSRQVAVALDASASMSASGTGGSAFERGKALVASTLAALPRGTRATAGAFALRYDSPFREPVQDRDAVTAVLNDAALTGGRGDVPRALRAAAESLERGGGGGTIWLLTDLQASDWRLGDPGEWEQVRAALDKAGKPQVVISDLNPGVETNFSIAAVSVTPSVLVEGDAPKLTATVALRGKSGAVANVGLFLDGQRVDAKTHGFAEPGTADVVFHLPPLKKGAHTGLLELSPDALPADDRYYFVLNTAGRIPVLVVDGAPSSVPFEGAADFVKLAVQPPESNVLERSPLAIEGVPIQELPGVEMGKFAAVVLADPPYGPQLAPETLRQLREYVAAGGLLFVFPGPHTDVAAWNEAKFPGPPIKSVAEAEGEKRIKLGPVAPTNPVVSNLPAEGLDRVLISRLFRFDTSAQAVETLIQTEGGEPFLVRLQVGKGKVYVFAVSAQADFSNLPLTPPFLLVLHRAVQSHLVEVATPLAQLAFAELRLRLPAGTYQMLVPDRVVEGRLTYKMLPLQRSPEGDVVFDRTDQTGVYRLVAGDVAPQDPESVPPVAALNVPSPESELERVKPLAIHDLLPTASLSSERADGETATLGESRDSQTAASTFPLAVLAVAFLVSEVVLAWSMSRPVKGSTAEEATGA